MTECVKKWVNDHGEWGEVLFKTLTSPSGGTFSEGELIRTMENVTTIHRLFSQRARGKAMRSLQTIQPHITDRQIVEVLYDPEGLK